MNNATAINIDDFEGALLERNAGNKSLARVALEMSLDAICQPMSSDCCGSNNYPEA